LGGEKGGKEMVRIDTFVNEKETWSLQNACLKEKM
jgi:hypothetical protein